MQLKRNDMAYVLAGKDKGKTGKVLRIIPETNRVLVEGVNFVKRHTRVTRAEQQAGGIIQKENPIHISNIAVFCKGCNRPTRVGCTKLEDGSKIRFCKKCNETL